jgi:hypothetical protein
VLVHTTCKFSDTKGAGAMIVAVLHFTCLIRFSLSIKGLVLTQSELSEFGPFCDACPSPLPRMRHLFQVGVVTSPVSLRAMIMHLARPESEKEGKEESCTHKFCSALYSLSVVIGASKTL